MHPTSDRLAHLLASELALILGTATPRCDFLGGHASSRVYYRIHGPTTSLIVMVLATGGPPDELGAAPSASAEPPFIPLQRYLHAGQLPVPLIHRVMLEQHLLVLEDLGDLTLEAAARSGTYPVRVLYEAAIDLLLDLQHYHRSAPEVPFGRRFTRDVLRAELEHFSEWFLDVYCQAVISPNARRHIDQTFDQIADELVAQPTCLVHRDFQSRNLMVQPTEAGARLRLIDFQDALLGPPLYDLVALLRDSYISLPTSLIDQLQQRFIQASCALAHAPFDTNRAFQLQTLQRKLKDTGRFVFIDRKKNNASFLPYIPRSLRYVSDALAALPEFQSLTQILEPWTAAHRAAAGADV